MTIMKKNNNWFFVTFITVEREVARHSILSVSAVK